MFYFSFNQTYCWLYLPLLYLACLAGSLRRFKKEQKSDEGVEGKDLYPSFLCRPATQVTFTFHLPTLHVKRFTTLKENVCKVVVRKDNNKNLFTEKIPQGHIQVTSLERQLENIN